MAGHVHWLGIILTPDNPPALEGQTFSEIIANHLNAMHTARVASLESEASKKQLGQMRGTWGYSQENSNLWKGPGTMIGRENK